MSNTSPNRPIVHATLTALTSLIGLTSPTGCLVAGVSSKGVAFLWPGGWVW